VRQWWKSAKSIKLHFEEALQALLSSEIEDEELKYFGLDK
jgi:hypothetical protein